MSAIEKFRNLYDLLMEINYHRADSDILEELDERPDSFVEGRLSIVRQQIARHRAARQRRRLESAMHQLREIVGAGIEGLNKILTREEQIQYATLFRRFKELGDFDVSILEDDLLLKLLERINKLNEPGEGT